MSVVVTVSWSSYYFVHRAITSSLRLCLLCIDNGLGELAKWCDNVAFEFCQNVAALLLNDSALGSPFDKMVRMS